jgi:dihydroorotate dehydrogenase
MSWFYRTFLRPALFAQDSEKIHNRTLAMLAWAGKHPSVYGLLSSLYLAEELPVELFGLKFPNPIGLAAGMDKQAAAVPVWAALGFGFSELGGVTKHPQPGNPSPRMFRAVKQQALINRMGFNNPGAEAMAARLAEWRKCGHWPKHPVGINLGKSKITPLTEAAEDYLFSFRLLREYADFFVVNVSSPNTPNLRQLQDKAPLDEILAALQSANQGTDSSPSASRASKPILVKVAPDLSFEALDEILELAGPRQIAGIVATNTTIVRPQTSDSALQKIYAESGGLSGRPLAQRSTEVIRHIYRQTCGKLPIIGVGGVFNADDAWEKITAGASLVQLYTGLVYEGPAVTRQIVAGLRSRLELAGLVQFLQAVGTQVG